MASEEVVEIHLLMEAHLGQLGRDEIPLQLGTDQRLVVELVDQLRDYLVAS